jgi:molybdopterin molybdotransferase
VPEPATPLTERPWEDVERMLDVDSALERVLAAFEPLPAVETPLTSALGMVLAADVVANHDVPPFRNSAMDGYAVRAVDTAGARWDQPVTLPISAQVAAGQGEVPALLPGQAIRIMTGAPLPLGADAVVRFEETDEPRQSGDGERAAVRIFRAARRLDNVREAGEDVAEGAAVLGAGTRLSAACLGVAASVGRETVSVCRRPSVAILSTGNEVFAPGDALAPGAIRDSNSIVLAAFARAWGADVRMLGIARDSLADLTGKLTAAADCDLIVTSGGVSLGDYDFVKDVLRSEGEIGIWQVRMKPGKPLAFGHIGTTPLLGLPGNPVAAAVSFILFGRPAIRRMLGHVDVQPATVEAVAACEIDNRGQRRHYVRVTLEPTASGPPLARPVGEQGAGILSSLAAADALLIVPETLERAEMGTPLRALLFDQ